MDNRGAGTLSMPASVDPLASQAMLQAAPCSEQGGLPAESPQVSLEDALREVSLRPRRADAHLQLGKAHLAAGDLDASERSYRRAVQLQPDLEEGVAGVLRQLAVASARQRCRLVLQTCGGGGALAFAAVSPKVRCGTWLIPTETNIPGHHHQATLLRNCHPSYRRFPWAACRPG